MQNIFSGIVLPKAERPAIVSARSKRALVRIVTSGKMGAATEGLEAYFQKGQNTYISSQTVRNILKKSGLRAFVKIEITL